MSSCSIHRSLNSLQSAISASSCNGDLANRESGIEVSSSSMEKINFVTNYQQHSTNYCLSKPKRLQNATTQTSPIEVLFVDDPYDQMEVLSQYSDNGEEGEIDEVDNVRKQYFRSYSCPFYPHSESTKAGSERVLVCTPFDSINEISIARSNIFSESLKAKSTSAPIIISKNHPTFSNTNVSKIQIIRFIFLIVSLIGFTQF